ncbi:MAG: PrgI family protein [Candidatus Terrybacteria bacterium]|nr:PrgI family protein [Candidatus Terrybacteria bacterium]
MRYQVPQFIEIESKIFGPLTLKQFIYLLGGAGIIFLFYVTLPFFLMILFSLPVAGFSLALAFYKVNNRPFIKILENALKYFFSSRLYLWKKVQPKAGLPKAGEPQPKAGEQPVYVPKFTQSKLKELSWSLDIKEKVE